MDDGICPDCTMLHQAALKARVRQLDGWYRTAKSAHWKSLADVRRTYSHADQMKVGDVVHTIFNIGQLPSPDYGDLLRKSAILVRHVLTHWEYDKEAWKKK
jgi:mRNA-degrading endonuclease HigB of HigAB toxin-antitoxin module